MSEEKRLDMYGGILGGAVPLAVLIIGLVWLCLAERGGTQPFWACAWLALVIGLFFARKKEDYCLAAMRGIGDENGIVIIYGLAVRRRVRSAHGCRRSWWTVCSGWA